MVTCMLMVIYVQIIVMSSATLSFNNIYIAHFIITFTFKRYKSIKKNSFTCEDLMEKKRDN